MPKKKNENEEEELKGLELALASIEKKYGKGSIFQIGDGPVPGTEWIPSGCKGLDIALGGGYARGRLVEIYGQEGGGKTTCSLHAIAEEQKLGGTCAFVDAEHALDLVYAQALGVQVDKLLVSQPDCGEQALDILESLIRSGEISLIVVDSVAALTPKAEIEGDITDQFMGLQARMMSKAMRKICAIAGQSKTCVIFINQMRQKIGVMWGSPETTTGGLALKFYASQRLDIRKKEAIGPEGAKTAIMSKIKVVKNKVAAPYRELEVNIIFGEGFDWAKDLIDYLVASGKIQKSGPAYLLGEEKLGYGEQRFHDEVKEQPELAAKLRRLL